MRSYVEDRIRAQLPALPPDKRQKAEKFLREQAEIRAAQNRADAAWAEFKATPRWRFLKRRKLKRAACLASAVFFRAAGDNSAATQMLSSI